MKHALTLISVAFLLHTFSACGGSNNGGTVEPKPQPKEIKIPSFDAEQAYNFIQKQVDFGPRVPKTPAHESCLQWLRTQFEQFGGTVTIQEGVMDSHLDPRMPIKNLIVAINPKQTRRVLLCAHWDTRYIADQDTARKTEPILGADDGGSGVGVLLEVARVIQQNPIELGIDIVLFDVEDQGETESNSNFRRVQTWCLGSQFWSRNNNGYTANFGILLDMVGSKGAKFPKEGISRERAGVFVNKVWNEALQQGYSDLFIPIDGNAITDDHFFINEFARIPTLDIINMPEGRTGFGAHWHTHNDNMKIIDKNTLKGVGQIVLNVLYKEAANVF